MPGKPHLENKNKWNRQFGVRSLEYAKDLAEGKSTFAQVIAWCHQQQTITWTSDDPNPRAILRHLATMIQLRNPETEFKEHVFITALKPVATHLNLPTGTTLH